MNLLTRLSGFFGKTEVLVAAYDAPVWQKLTADYVCDGHADQDEINDALSLVNQVRLSEGTFTLTGSVSLGANQRLRGAGIGLTTLTLRDSKNAHLISASSVARVTLGDLTLDGNGTNQSANGRCLNWTSVTDARVERVHGLASRDNTFNLSGCARVDLVGCNAESALNANTGFQVYQSAHVRLLHCRGTGHNSTVKFDDADHGVVAFGSFDVLGVGHGAINIKGGSVNCRVVSNYATGMSNGHSGVEVYGSYNLIEGNVIEGRTLNNATGCGIELSGSTSGGDCTYNLVRGNLIHNVRENAVWLRRESGSSAAITRNVIEGNTLKDDQSSNRASYGVKEDTPADTNYVRNNLVVGFATAALTLQAATDAAKSGNVTS